MRDQSPRNLAELGSARPHPKGRNVSEEPRSDCGGAIFG